MHTGLARLLSCALATAPLLCHALPRYDITPLPFSSRSVFGGHLNNLGVVVGNMVIDDGIGDYRWYRFSANGSFESRPVSWDGSSYLAAINDHGAMASSQRDDITTQFAYRHSAFTGGSMEQLKPLSLALPYWTSFPRAINNGGQVVGESISATGPQHAVLWTTPDQVTDLGTLGGSDSRAHDINDAGVVTGGARTGDIERMVAFRYANGTMQALNGLENTGSEGLAINAAGDIVGYASPDEVFVPHAFLHQGGVLTMLDMPAASGSTAYDINDAGAVVGTMTLAGSTEQRGFLYENGAMIELGTLVDPAWTVRQAKDINNPGQIFAEVCQGQDCRWALLTPVPEPATWALLAVGLPLAATLARRRGAAGPGKR